MDRGMDDQTGIDNTGPAAMRRKLSLLLVIVAVVIAFYFIFFPVRLANPTTPVPGRSPAVENSAS